ncbi:MAG: Gfo/Idh/MocA family oxidoreductase [Pseudomonadota bacterium]
MSGAGPLRVGLVGCGSISEAYLRLAPCFRDFEIVAVTDIDATKAASTAQAFDVTALTPADLMAAPDIDVVLNLTIPAAHAEVTRQALTAGKHVYSEKPLVLSLSEGLALDGLAREGGLRIGAAPDTFLGGAHQWARAQIDAGSIGAVVAGSAAVMSHGMEHWHPNPAFFYQAGAGPVLDMGPYYLTNLVQLLGPIARVAALATTPQRHRLVTAEGPMKGTKIVVETPTNVHALLAFASGATVSFVASWDVHAHCQGPMALYGGAGTLYVPDPNAFGGDVAFEAAPDAPATLPDLWHGQPHPLARPNQGAVANYRGVGLADMAHAIRAGVAHRCSFGLALHVVEAMAAILEAGQSGQWQHLSTTCDRPAPLEPREAAALLHAA